MKNVEINLFNMFLRNMGIIKNMHLNGILGEEEYNEVLKTGDELINIITNLEVKMKMTNTLGSFSENSKKIERLQREYIHYLELLIKKYSKVENVEHSYYTLLSQISRLQEKAGKRRNG